MRLSLATTGHRGWTPVALAIAAGVLMATFAARAQQAPIGDYPIRAVAMSAVKVTGGFWAGKMETNRVVTIPHIFDENESTGRVANLRKGAGLEAGDYVGRRFNDTDLYKIIEAASFSLAAHPDPVLQKKVGDLVAIIAKAQQPDGYLFPARTINPQKPAAGVGTERWEYENTGSHELYNAGHLIEAGVASRLSGENGLFGVATKFANLIDRTFGPDKRVDAPGHEEVELALVKLYRATGDRRYFDLAKFFLDTRGTDHHASKDYTEQSWQLYNDRPYRQDDKPLVQQTIGEGHAVRGVYVYSAMTDIAGMSRSRDAAAYDAAVDRIWQDVYSKRAYITGGLGSVGGTEAFGAEYQLPNRTAYTETCASVGAILWNHRMFLKSGDAKYLDAFEQTLYNGLLSGVSVKGDTFFYQNPLEANNVAGRGRAAGGPDTSQNADRRSPYFDVACCPANLARLIAQLPGLIYSVKGNEIYVNLFVNSEADVNVGNATVHIKQTTNYPWEGRATISVSSTRSARVVVHTRTPGWAGASPFATDLYTFANAGPAKAATGWTAHRVSATSREAVVSVDLPMPVRRVVANENLKEDAGKTAIMRGPIVYAFEGVDNDGKALDISVPAAAAFTPAFRKDLLGGVTVLTAKVGDRTITAIPYFAWANRGRGEMAVWVRDGEK